MKIAQNCPYCKEFFVTEVRLKTCPFCEKALPEKVGRVKMKADTQDPAELLNFALEQWKLRKSALQTNEHTAGHRAEIDKLLTAIKIAVPSISCNAKQVKQPEVLEKFVEEPSTDIIKEFVGVREQVQLLYNLVYGFLAKNNEQIKSKQLASEELCDFGFICRDLENILDELRKELKARKELCGQIIAFRKTQESIQDPSISMKVQGQFATGTPDVKMQAALPHKFTDEYYQITDYLGVPRDVASSGVLRLDWKRVTEFLTQLTRDGKQIPEGFGKQYPSYVTVYRKRKVK